MRAEEEMRAEEKLRQEDNKTKESKDIKIEGKNEGKRKVDSNQIIYKKKSED